MNINEVNRQDDMQQARNIVQQMFHKKNQIMQWNSDSKPTVRELIKQLDDPFLISLTKDLDYFVKYGQAWVDLNPNDIFADTSAMPTVDDMLADPKYYANQKSTVFRKVTMRPTMYAIHAKHGFKMGEYNAGHQNFTPEDHLVQEYAIQVLSGSKMPLTYLKYELVQVKHGDTVAGEYTAFGQEGRHRAAVAILLGAESMPVLIIAQVSPPSDDFNDLADFSKKIFKAF